MARRGFAWKTPDEAEAVDIICRPLFIPRPFLHIVGGALSELTNKWRWEEAGTITPERATELMAYMLKRFYEEGCCESMDVRQSPTNPCILQKTQDGVTWEDWADLSLCAPELRKNPATGQIEVSHDGSTWEPIPTGPWEETGGITYVETRPRPEATDEEKRCNAAANAALVLQQLYRDTFDRFVATVANTALDIAQMLTTGLSNLIGINVPSFLAIENGQYLMNNSESFTEGGFPDTDLETVRCILYEHSTVDADGVVTFDGSAVSAAFGAEHTASGDPFGGLNLLLFVLGTGALNVAGAVQATTAADCECEEGPSGTCRLGGNGTANLFTEYSQYDAVNDWIIDDDRPEGFMHLRTTFSLNAQTFWKRVWVSAEWQNVAPNASNGLHVKANAWNGTTLHTIPIEGTGSFEGWLDLTPNQYSVHIDMVGWAGGSWVGKYLRLKLICFDPA